MSRLIAYPPACELSAGVCESSEAGGHRPHGTGRRLGKQRVRDPRGGGSPSSDRAGGPADRPASSGALDGALRHSGAGRRLRDGQPAEQRTVSCQSGSWAGSAYSVWIVSGSATPACRSSIRFPSLPMCLSGGIGRTCRRASSPTVSLPQGWPSGPRDLASGWTRYSVSTSRYRSLIERARSRPRRHPHGTTIKDRSRRRRLPR